MRFEGDGSIQGFVIQYIILIVIRFQDFSWIVQSPPCTCDKYYIESKIRTRWLQTVHMQARCPR